MISSKNLTTLCPKGQGNTGCVFWLGNRCFVRVAVGATPFTDDTRGAHGAAAGRQTDAPSRRLRCKRRRARLPPRVLTGPAAVLAGRLCRCRGACGAAAVTPRAAGEPPRWRVGARPRLAVPPPYGNRCRIKPGSPAQSQIHWAAIGTGIKPGSMAL